MCGHANKNLIVIDKWERVDKGYRTDLPDGVYEVAHIVDIEKPLDVQHKRSRIVEIKDGSVQVCGIGVPGGTPKDKIMTFSQLCFFEVNFVVDYIPAV